MDQNVHNYYRSQCAHIMHIAHFLCFGLIYIVSILNPMGEQIPVKLFDTLPIHSRQKVGQSDSKGWYNWTPASIENIDLNV